MSALPKKSLILDMIPGNLPLEDRFALAKRAGFEGVEVPPRLDDAGWAGALRAASEKSGLPVHSVIFGSGGWGWPHLAEPEPEKRAQALENLKKGLRFAKAAGADVLLLVPAVVHAKIRYAEAYERSQAGIRQAIPLAEELGVTIGVEVIWNNFLLSPLEFARYIDEFDHPRVRAYFDVGNIVKNGWPEDWIRTLGKRICRIHLKDFSRKQYKAVNLGDGDINWKEVRKALAEAEFTSFMTAEVEGGDEAYLKDLAQRMERLLIG